MKLLRDQLPTSLLHKVSVSLHSFGATECLTRLTDKRWDYMQSTQAGWGWSNRNNYTSNNNANYNNTSNGRYNNKLSSSSSDGNLRYPTTDRTDTRKVDTPGHNTNGSVYISANTTTSMDSMTIAESVAVTYPVNIAPVLEVALPTLTISSEAPTPPLSSNQKNRSSNYPSNHTNNNINTSHHYYSNNPHNNKSAKNKNKNKKNNRGVVCSAHSHWGINRPYKQPGQVYMNNHHPSGSSNKDNHEQH